MKTLILLFTISFSLPGQARDCLKDVIKYKYAEQIFDWINSDLEFLADEAKICKKWSNGIEYQRAYFNEILADYRKEIQRRGDLSEEEVQFLFFQDYPALTPDEMCEKLDILIQENLSCYTPRAHYEEVIHSEILDAPASLTCQKLLPSYKKRFKECHKRKLNKNRPEGRF